MSENETVAPNSSSSRQLMKVFDSSTGPEPQERCLQWARENSVQNGKIVPFMIVAQEGGPHGRAYVAATYEQLFNRAKMYGQTHDTGRHMQEVVLDGPTKMYCDFELKFEHAHERQAATASLNESSDIFIRDIVAFVRDKYGVVMEPLILASHGEFKWSRHVIFDNAMWETNAHCLAVLVDVVRATFERNPLIETYLDTSVYNINRCFRMYRCTKHEAPERSLLLESGENAPPQPIDESIWLRSLITCFCIEREPRPTYITALFMMQCEQYIWRDEPGDIPRPLAHEAARTLGRKGLEDAIRAALGRAPLVGGSGGGGGGGGGASAVTRISYRSTGAADGITVQQKMALSGEPGQTLLNYFMKYEPSQLAYRPLPSSIVTIRCKSRECEIWGAEHESSHISISVDFLNDRWRQQCFLQKCASLPPMRWRTFTEVDMLAACQELRNVWPMAQCTPKLRALYGAGK